MSTGTIIEAARLNGSQYRDHRLRLATEAGISPENLDHEVQSILQVAVPHLLDQVPKPSKPEVLGEWIAMIRGSDVAPQLIEWLWPGWLASGKVHILGGAPGTGKTTISMALAAAISQGGSWPDGARSPVGKVVIWSGEDDPADTLIPRLKLSGARLENIYFVGNVHDGHERRAFDPASDTGCLMQRLIDLNDVRLLIIDPIVSGIAGDSHKNAEVRRGLQPLADLAASLRCALLGITHFSKGTTGREPVERLTGSLAFGAVARIVMVAAKHQELNAEGSSQRVLLRAKSNIGPDRGGFAYELMQSEIREHPGVTASFVQWREPIDGTAREILREADEVSDDGDHASLPDAKQFLKDLLSDGPKSAKDVRKDADGAGYSWATIRRAQQKLGIKAQKEGGHFGGYQRWVWSLPITDD
jgi:putative DNA primase/helicase